MEQRVEIDGKLGYKNVSNGFVTFDDGTTLITREPKVVVGPQTKVDPNWGEGEYRNLAQWSRAFKY